MAVTELTSAALEAGTLEGRLPEFYALRGTVEDNLWHRRQTVFDHCVKVVRSLEEILEEIRSLTYVDARTSAKLLVYLERPVGQFRRRDLLLISSILHDIAKPETLITDEQGHTSCPGHDLLASFRVRNFASRFGLDPEGQQYVEQLVKDHELAFKVMTWGEKHTIEARDLAAYLARVMPLTYIELMIHEDADMRGCDAPLGQLEHYQRLLWSLLKEACP